MSIDDKDVLNTHLIAQSVNVEQQSSDIIKECLHVREESWVWTLEDLIELVFL